MVLETPLQLCKPVVHALDILLEVGCDVVDTRLEQQEGLIEFRPRRIDFSCDSLGQVALETDSQTVLDQIKIEGRRSERGIGVAVETINSFVDVVAIKRSFGRLSIGVNR